MILNTLHPNLLRKRDANVIERYKHWYFALKPIIDDLNIPYAIIKGDVLSIWAYGENGYRDSNDVDLLISKNDVPFVCKILEKHGFTNRLFDEMGNLRELTRSEKIMFANSHQTCPYYKDLANCDRPLKVDVNFDVFWGEYTGERIDISEFLSDTIEMNLYGYTVNSLSMIKAFVEVCLHHYNEMNSIYIFKWKNTISTKMFQDIYCFYKRHIENNIYLLLDYSEKHKIHQFIYYMLFYTNKVFPDNLLEKHLKLFETLNGIEELEFYGLTNTEKRKWRVDFYTRLDAPNIFSYIQSDLKQIDYDKENQVNSIYKNVSIKDGTFLCSAKKRLS